MIKLRYTWLPLALCASLSAGCGIAGDQPTIERITAPAPDKATTQANTTAQDETGGAKPTGTDAPNPESAPTTATNPGESGTAAVAFAEATKSSTPEACQYFKAAEISKILGREVTEIVVPDARIGQTDQNGVTLIQECGYNTSAGSVIYRVGKHPGKYAEVLEKSFKEVSQGLTNESPVSIERVDIGDFGGMYLSTGETSLNSLQFAIGNYSVSLTNQRKKTDLAADELKKMAQHVLSQAKR